MLNISLSDLPDRALLDEAQRVVAHERRATAQVIALLMELDARRLYLGEGYSSLFVYCTQVLHLSEHATYGRIEAARAARRFPLILELLADGSITLTTVTLLASELTPENHRALLARARHKSKRDILLLVAELHPRPAVEAAIRKLPAPKPVARAAGAGVEESLIGECADGQTHSGSSAATMASTLPPPRPAVMIPLAPERYKIQFTVTRETHEKLRRVQNLLRHAIPNGDPAEIFDRALTLLLDDVGRTKLAATDHPRRSGPTAPGTRHIPAAVKRAVWARDDGRCTFVGTDGRCGETGFLEFHHVVPYAAGGAPTVENLQLLCAAHNKHEADCFFGPSQLRERRA